MLQYNKEMYFVGDIIEFVPWFEDDFIKGELKFGVLRDPETDRLSLEWYVKTDSENFSFVEVMNLFGGRKTCHDWEGVWLSDDLEGYRCKTCGHEAIDIWDEYVKYE